MTKKSVEILGLPIISISEGRELGISKTLLIDAKNNAVVAIVIEDEEWYQGAKFLPYSSVIAIGCDTITIKNSDSILTFKNAGDYEAILKANIRIIGTKAITKSGSIKGKISEIYIGEDGKIEKCVIITKNGTESEISVDQISIFGKQVTVIDIPEEDLKEDQIIKFEISETIISKPLSFTKPMPTSESNPVADKMDKVIAEKTIEDSYRRFLLGRKATRDIATDSGIIFVKAGARITEAILQKAKLTNKLIELSLNVL